MIDEEGPDDSGPSLVVGVDVPYGSTGRILFQDKADRYPERYQAAQLREQRGTDRTPCPVCGHPTGDCTNGDHQMAVSSKSVKEAKKPVANKGLNGPKQGKATEDNPLGVPGAGIKPGADPAKVAGSVTVKEDVFEERPIVGSTLKKRILVAAAGTTISAAKVEALKARGVKLPKGK